MADPSGRLIVRTHAPRKRAALLTTAIVGGAMLLYGAFELGRYDAGFRVVDSVRGALAASRRIRELEAENTRQREQLAAADVARRVDHEGYQQVERNLGDMQSQLARLNQDLSFYRGLVQPESLIHVKVQQMQIVPDGDGRFRLKFVLTQTAKPDKEVAGSAVVSVDGLLRGRPTLLSLAEVSPNRRAGLAYSFRYFQNYDEPVQLPPGFEPTRIEVEIRSGRDAVHTLRQAFVWKAQGMSLETAPSKDAVDVQTQTE